MTPLRVTLTCQNKQTAELLVKELQKKYKKDLQPQDDESSIFLETVLSDEDWACITRKFTKKSHLPVEMRASAAFVGVYKVYKSTFKDGKEFEEEPEIHTIFDEPDEPDVHTQEDPEIKPFCVKREHRDYVHDELPFE